MQTRGDVVFSRLNVVAHPTYQLQPGDPSWSSSRTISQSKQPVSIALKLGLLMSEVQVARDLEYVMLNIPSFVDVPDVLGRAYNSNPFTD